MIDAPALRGIYFDANAFIEAFEHEGSTGELLVSPWLGLPASW
jgi:hypothetical protein